MDKGTLVFPALLTPDIFPIISICPDPPLRNWEKTFGKYMDNPEEAWQTMVLEKDLNTSEAIWELHKELSYDEKDIITNVSVVYKELFLPFTTALIQEEPVSQEIGEDKQKEKERIWLTKHYGFQETAQHFLYLRM